MADPFVCSDCTRRTSEPGDCTCGAGMLYDLRDVAMADALRDDDQRRVDRAKQRNIWIGVGAGVAAMGALLALNPAFLLLIPLPIPFANPAKVVLITLAVAALVLFVANQLFPGKRRFPYLAYGAQGGASAARMKTMKGSTVAAIGLGVGAVVATTAGLVVALSNSSPNPNKPGSKTKVAAVSAPREDDALLATSDFATHARGVSKLQGKVDLEGGGYGLLYSRGRGAWTACTVRPSDAQAIDCSELAPPLRESSVHLVAGQSRVLIGGVTRMGATPEETEYGVFDASGEKIASTLEGYSLSDGDRVPALGDTWVDVAGVKVKQGAGGLYLERSGAARELLMSGAAMGQPLVLVSGDTAVIVFVRGGEVQALRVTAAGAAAI